MNMNSMLSETIFQEEHNIKILGMWKQRDIFTGRLVLHITKYTGGVMLKGIIPKGRKVPEMGQKSMKKNG
jgi:hypothetical protein